MEVRPRVRHDGLARLEKAKEKASIMEKRFVTALSELEQAAEKWKKEMERWTQDPR